MVSSLVMYAGNTGLYLHFPAVAAILPAVTAIVAASN